MYRKLIYLFSFVLVVSQACNAVEVARWDFEETSGTTATDQSGLYVATLGPATLLTLTEDSDPVLILPGMAVQLSTLPIVKTFDSPAIFRLRSGSTRMWNGVLTLDLLTFRLQMEVYRTVIVCLRTVVTIRTTSSLCPDRMAQIHRISTPGICPLKPGSCLFCVTISTVMSP